MRRMKSGYFLMVVAIPLVSACATNRSTGWQSDSPRIKITDGEKQKLLSEIQQLWESRHERASLESALEKLETLSRTGSETDPEHLGTLTLLSRGYYLLADAHVDRMEEKKRIWETGTKWGEKAMAIHPTFRRIVVTQQGKVEDGVSTLDQRFQGAIYWTAVNLGSWSKNSGIATALKYKSLIRRMIEKVEALNPAFFYGAVYRYWGVYYAVVPEFAGGNLLKSLENFQKAFRMEENYLANHTLFAEIYTTRKNDPNSFRRHLEKVILSDPNSVPAIRSENLIEQTKAKKLLTEIDKYF